MPASTSEFESELMAHLDAAHNLARWLVRNDSDADDVVQESCMKALRAYDSLRGGDFKPWFLTIVRNTSFTWLSRNKSSMRAGALSLEAGAEVPAEAEAYDPHAMAIRAADAELVRRAIDTLPDVWREMIALREMDGLSYKEISNIAGVPIGTVMSRLARARTQLQLALMKLDPEAAQ